MVGEISDEEFTEGGREDGPWDTEPCLFCKQPTLRSQTTMPEMWPCTVICHGCKHKWDSL